MSSATNSQVQYYRSVRGNLQPLLTEPSRRSFPLPSGKAKYQQTKLLREEHHKNVIRRQNIEKFFTDLFTHQTGNTCRLHLTRDSNWGK